MIPKVNGLTYQNLAEALCREGFTEKVDTRGRTFEHPSGARLPLLMLSDSEPLRTYHLIATRDILNDYRILSADKFDLLILRMSQVETLAP